MRGLKIRHEEKVLFNDRAISVNFAIDGSAIYPAYPSISIISLDFAANATKFNIQLPAAGVQSYSCASGGIDSFRAICTHRYVHKEMSDVSISQNTMRKPIEQVCRVSGFPGVLTLLL